MVTFYEWATRCIPAFTSLILGLLLVFSFVISPYGKGDEFEHNGEATTPQYIFGVYCAFLHVLSIVFPIRVCLSMRYVLQRTRASLQDMSCNRERSPVRDGGRARDASNLLFVIILPAYKEDMATLEETLRVLACHAQARHSYHIYLAMEEKEAKSAVKAAGLCSTFQQSFFEISYTVHPTNIPGEAQGKSSNEAWAARQVMRDYQDEVTKRNTIVTVMDADTHLSSRYFTQVARLHNECTTTNTTTMYVPPLVFDRNLHRVPLFVRTSDLMWAGAGLSSMYQKSSVVIPTSVYSLPLTLVERVGGWDTGPGAIGEDMHMYLKCFFALSGNLTVQKIYSAASQCNVSSDEKGIAGYYYGLEARYKQALRHMWGSLDTGFAIRESVKMFQRRKSDKGIRVNCSSSAPMCSEIQKHHNADANNRSLNKISPCIVAGPIDDFTRVKKVQANIAMPIHWVNVLTLYHRLFEAHFLPTHLVTMLATSGIYCFFYPASSVPTFLQMVLDFSGYCRLIGYCTMLIYFYNYERYHRLCVGLRKEEMRRAGMLKDMENHDGFTPHVFQYLGLFEIATFPLGGFIFGAAPALQAVLSHVFTDRLTYVVSLKPQLTLRPWKDISVMTPSSYTKHARKVRAKSRGKAKSEPVDSAFNSIQTHRRRISNLIQFSQFSKDD